MRQRIYKDVVRRDVAVDLLGLRVTQVQQCE